MKTTETLLHARWVIPVEPDAVVLEYHKIAIDEGRISAILPSAESIGRINALSPKTHAHRATVATVFHNGLGVSVD